MPNDPRAIPYLLPPFHPAKAILDEIFSTSDTRIITSKQSLKKIGKFHHIRQGCSQCYVAHHKKLVGYIIKVYTDDFHHDDPLAAWIRRIEGANAIRKLLKKRDLSADFQVPKKWVYPIPRIPTSAVGLQQKHYILVAEDMDPLNTHANQTLWMSLRIDPPLLDQLYCILSQLGLYDSVYLDNIPFSRNGKITFIDTEHHHKWPVPYHKLQPYFRPSMQLHWENTWNRKEVVVP